MALNVVRDVNGLASKAGYSAWWFRWNKAHDHTYIHDKQDGWVRLVLWGGRSIPASLVSFYGEDPLWRFMQPIGGSGVSEFAPFTYRVWLNKGDRLRIRLGGRCTKQSYTSAGEQSWDRAGTIEEWTEGELTRGGYPDGGDGVSQTSVVVDGNHEALSTTAIDHRCNGAGGASRVWLTPRPEGGSPQPERLIITEPGEGGIPAHDPLGILDPFPNGARTESYMVTYKIFSGEDGFIDNGSFFNYVINWEKNKISFTGPIANTSPEHPGPGVGLAPEAHSVLTEGDPVGLGTEAGDLIYPDPKWNIGYWSSESVNDRFTKEEIRYGESGWSQDGADGVPSVYGPRLPGGGGYGGGGGGNVLAVITWRVSGELEEPIDTQQWVQFSGRPGGRWWNDDRVERIDLSVANGPCPDHRTTTQEIDPLEYVNDYYAHHVDISTYESGPKIYESAPWLFGFGAMWLCPEDPADDKRAGWNLRRIGWGRTEGW